MTPREILEENVTASNPSPFIHLHVHTEYSLTDGAIRIDELISKVKTLGHDAVAITDHGNLFGAVEFYGKAKAAGIKPILGAEVFEQPSPSTQAFWKESPDAKRPLCFKAVHLARNNQGYGHLVKTVSAGYMVDVDQEVPVCPLEKVAELAQGQVFISSFYGGEFSYLAAQLLEEFGEGFDCRAINPQHPILASMKNFVEFVKSNFGPDNGFAEICHNGMPGDQALMKAVANCAHFLDFPLIASANAHYLDPKDKEAHLILLGIKNDLKLTQLKNRRKNVWAHVTTNEEVERFFAPWPEAISNTKKVADRCQVTFEFGKYYLPKIELDKGESTEAALIRLSNEGLLQRFDHIRRFYGDAFDEEKQKEYQARLDHELQVIIKMGFPDYFLIVQDFINWAKQQDIPVGPGRGSGAGSLVAYALRITDLDPIPYNLIFERFLNPERVSMPDFDVDFCQDRRDEVIDYVTQRYGKTNVAQITTFGKMLAKAVVRDVGRAMDLSYGKVDRIAKLIPNELGIKLQDAIDREPRLREEASKDPMIADLLRIALQLEGLCRHTSVHAAGIVISDGAMENYVPVYQTEDGSLITQFEMKNAEKVGLVKFDFLGLKTLTVIQKACQLIKKTTGEDLIIEDIPMHDAKVFELVSAARSVGVFQLESSGMQQLLLKLKPSSFEDFIALVALFRPGPLGSGMVDDFVERKHGRQEIEYLHPELEPILKDTYGTILYQEQVQKVAAILANYTLGEADLLRRAMGKKKPEEMAKQKTRFIEGCSANGIDPAISNQLFDMMAKFAEYGFNKSHSAAYGLVSYQTAFLKAHHPAQYMAAIMTCDMDNTDKIVRYAHECRALNLKLLPPSLNQSDLEFSVPKKGCVRFGLAAIKGIGSGSLETLVQERNAGGPYQNLTDLAKRINLHAAGKKTLELLIQAGAFDEFGFQRRSMLACVGELVKYSRNHHEAKSQGQALLFADEDTSQDESDQFGNLDERPVEHKQEPANDWLIREKKLLGVYLTSHPLKLFAQDKAKFTNAKFKELPALAGQSEIYCLGILVDYFERTTKDGKRMMILRIEDEEELISPALFEGEFPQEMPPAETPIICKFRVMRGFENLPPRPKLLEIYTLDQFRRAKVKQINITIHARQGASATVRQDLLAAVQKSLPPMQSGTLVGLKLKMDSATVKLSCPDLRIDLNNDLIQNLANIRLEGNRCISIRY